jgi:23S rRNA (guanine2069-N7)-methyltransferase / 23S rRNA (guanine2445-N2)-methyltransferase
MIATSVAPTPAATMHFFATCPAGVAELLADELRDAGATRVRVLRAGVDFDGCLECAYRACLWSRTASRILHAIAEVPADSAERLYTGVRSIDWTLHLAPQGTIAIDVLGTNEGLRHTRFTAQKVKDGIVDAVRASHGERPNVDLEHPDLRINVRLHRDRATLSVDLSGDSLHRRGYRLRGVAAPLKENLAAAILLRSGWRELAARGGALVDPMCGSGTFVIEAALIAAGIAPGLSRTRFGFEGWRGHDEALWRRVREEAVARNETPRPGACRLRGYDRDPRAIQVAIENAARAGVAGLVHFERRELAELRREDDGPGLVVVNPPYGERIGRAEELRDLYAMLGERVRAGFEGWQLSVLAADPALARAIGMQPRRSHALANGPIECRLLRFDVRARDAANAAARFEARLREARTRPGAEMFANRLRKNLKALGSWLRREDVHCFRLYDADMPEYAFAIDVYGDGQDRWVSMQEYLPPAAVAEEAARARRLEALAVVPEVLAIDPGHVYRRLRRSQKTGTQYARLADEAVVHAVREGPYRFRVNFTDYLDTGLFLDHRITRARIGAAAGGTRFLNLFAYTGSMTVAAVGGGALASTSVDLSRTYLDWARRNLELNGLAAPAHELVRADCRAWLATAARQRQALWDLIFLDPPTHSRSKRMQHDFEVQRDHPRLIELAMELLAPSGLLVFSCNYSRFKLAAGVAQQYEVEDITRATIPRDFARSPRIHVCYEIRRRGSSRP